ncbi:uncharacterized protein FN964_003517 [Alca torda]
MLPPPRPPLGPPRRRHLLLPPHTAPPPPPAPHSHRESLRAGPAGSTRGGGDNRQSPGGAIPPPRRYWGLAAAPRGSPSGERGLFPPVAQGSRRGGVARPACSGVTTQFLSKYVGFERGKKLLRFAPDLSWIADQVVHCCCTGRGDHSLSVLLSCLATSVYLSDCQRMQQSSVCRESKYCE